MSTWPKKELKILLAEDDPNDAEIFEIAIKRSGLATRLMVARDGQEAIDYLSGNEPFKDRGKFPFPNLLIMDIRMPHVDGFHLLVWMRTHPQCCVIPTLIFSASDQPEDVRKAYQLGANSYITKPSQVNEVVDLIRIVYNYWHHCEAPLPAHQLEAVGTHAA
jgi:CheY-like chemotaxis protein